MCNIRANSLAHFVFLSATASENFCRDGEKKSKCAREEKEKLNLFKMMMFMSANGRRKTCCAIDKSYYTH
jgi:hypothetical protein